MYRASIIPRATVTFVAIFTLTSSCNRPPVIKDVARDDTLHFEKNIAVQLLEGENGVYAKSLSLELLQRDGSSHVDLANKHLIDNAFQFNTLGAEYIPDYLDHIVSTSWNKYLQRINRDNLTYEELAKYPINRKIKVEHRGPIFIVYGIYTDYGDGTCYFHTVTTRRKWGDPIELDFYVEDQLAVQEQLTDILSDHFGIDPDEGGKADFIMQEDGVRIRYYDCDEPLLDYSLVVPYESIEGEYISERIKKW